MLVGTILFLVRSPRRGRLGGIKSETMPADPSAFHSGELGTNISDFMSVGLTQGTCSRSRCDDCHRGREEQTSPQARLQLCSQMTKALARRRRSQQVRNEPFHA